MANINREDIIERAEEWGINSLEKLEKTLGRKITDDEVREILLYAIGYESLNGDNLERLVNNLGIYEFLTSEEFEKIKDIKC